MYDKTPVMAVAEIYFPLFRLNLTELRGTEDSRKTTVASASDHHKI